VERRGGRKTKTHKKKISQRPKEARAIERKKASQVRRDGLAIDLRQAKNADRKPANRKSCKVRVAGPRTRRETGLKRAKLSSTRDVKMSLREANAADVSGARKTAKQKI
jgi:hypothetical protein